MKLFRLVVACAIFNTLSAMTLEHNIGSVLGAAIPINSSPEQLAKFCSVINQYHIGTVLLDRIGTIDQEINVINTILANCPSKPLIAQDLEWGLTMRMTDGIRFPHALTCGAIQDDSLIFQMAQEIARQTKLLGVDINFAPVADINSNPRNPVIGDRSFGQNRNGVTAKALAYLDGLRSGGIVGCAKHFPGHGDTSVDSHLDLPVIAHDEARLREVELYPFVSLITHDVPCIMPAHINIPALCEAGAPCATLSKKLVTGLLREELGFRGVIVADALRMQALTKYNTPQEIVLKAFDAGIDLLLAPADIVQAANTLLDAARQGRIDPADIARRAERINALRTQAGTDAKVAIDGASVKKLLETDRAYKLKRTLYAAAVTRVRAQDNAIPCALGHDCVIVQIGGPAEAAFVRELRIKRADLETSKISTHPDGMEINELSAQLDSYKTVVIGLFDIDKRDFTHFGLNQNAIDMIMQLAKEKQVILTIFGSPYSLKLFDAIPNVIMAYEDDPDAQLAAAHVITGELEPTGVLPITPESA